MSSKSYSPVDAKREEFRKYLEKEGIIQCLTSVLVSLYEEPEKPKDAFLYLKNNLGGGVSNSDEEVGKIRKENADLLLKIEELQKQNAALLKDFSDYKAKAAEDLAKLSKVTKEEEEEEEPKMEAEEPACPPPPPPPPPQKEEPPREAKESEASSQEAMDVTPEEKPSDVVGEGSTSEAANPPVSAA